MLIFSGESTDKHVTGSKRGGAVGKSNGVEKRMKMWLGDEEEEDSEDDEDSGDSGDEDEEQKTEATGNDEEHPTVETNCDTHQNGVINGISEEATHCPSIDGNPLPTENFSSTANAAEASVQPSSEAVEEPLVHRAIDLSQYSSAEMLESVGVIRLKPELMNRGMKCGGTLKQRAERLFQVK